MNSLIFLHLCLSLSFYLPQDELVLKHHEVRAGDCIGTGWISICSTLFLGLPPLSFLCTCLSVMAFTAGVARGQKDSVRTGQGKGQNEVRQMKRLLGELERRCMAGTAYHQRRQKLMNGMKHVEWIMKPSPSKWSSSLWKLPSKVIKGEQSFRLIKNTERHSCLSTDRFGILLADGSGHSFTET